MKNCKLEYQTVKSSELAARVRANYQTGTKLDFEDVCHVKTIQILTSNEKLSETVNTPKVSPIFMLILFRNASDADSENFVNPGVKSI